jgi:hypothetical protein
MNLIVDDQRQALITNPEKFAAGELTPLVITGLVSPDQTSLELGLFAQDGSLLALCSSLTIQLNGSVTGNLDCRTVPIQGIFFSKLPNYSLPVFLALIDKNRLWISQCVELVNNPLYETPVAPDPAKHYLTTADFVEITSTPPEDIGDAFDLLIALQAVVKET